jgi:hypothetical protein
MSGKVSARMYARGVFCYPGGKKLQSVGVDDKTTASVLGVTARLPLAPPPQPVCWGGVKGAGFRVQGSGFMVQGLEVDLSNLQYQCVYIRHQRTLVYISLSHTHWSLSVTHTRTLVSLCHTHTHAGLSLSLSLTH